MVFHPDKAFDLPPLPPNLKEKDLFNPKITQLVIKANRSISELKGACHALPNAYALLLNIPVLQEATSSSAIEGIHTTVETLLEAQIKVKKDQDPASKEALRYREALNAGVKSFRKYRSLSTRTILTIHRRLLPQGGLFKQQMNKIVSGKKAIYTPPSPAHIAILMGNWETYIHSLNGIDPLIKTAIAHYQFEAIHPFSDGNGRTGRILIVLQLLLYQLLEWPVLYISGYLIKHRKKYYSLLLNTSKSGKWIEFITFFLIAFDKQAKQTKKVIMDIIKARDRLKQKLKKEHQFIYSRDFLDHIFSYPITHAIFMADKLDITYQTASKYLSILEKNKILRKKKSGTYKLYYNPYLLDCLKT